MSFGIKRTPLDIEFSLYIRNKAGGRCERCKKPSRLECSHFYGRGGHSTRWDEENCIGICCGCHSFLGANPEDHREFFLKRLGQEKYDALVRRAHTPTKFSKEDKNEMRLKFKKLNKEFEGEILGKH